MFKKFDPHASKGISWMKVVQVHLLMLALAIFWFYSPIVNAESLGAEGVRCTLARKDGELIRASCERQPLFLRSFEEGHFDVDILAGFEPINLHGEQVVGEGALEHILRRMSLLAEDCRVHEGCRENVSEIEMITERGCDQPLSLLELYSFLSASGKHYKDAMFGRGVLCNSQAFRWMIYDSIFTPLHHLDDLSDDQIRSQNDQLQIYIYREN